MKNTLRLSFVTVAPEAHRAWRARPGRGAGDDVVSSGFAFTQVDVFTERPLARQPARRRPRRRRARRGADAGVRAVDQPQRDDLPARAHRPGGRLPGAHLHARRRAAFRRPSDARQLPRLARARRRAEDRRVGSCSSAASAWSTFAPRPGAPPSRRRPLRMAEVEAPLLAEVLRALGLEPDAVLASQWLDNGPHWLGLLLRDAAAVLALAPGFRGAAQPRQGRRRRRLSERVGMRVRAAGVRRRWSVSPKTR